MQTRVSYTQMKNISRHAWLPWAFVSLLALLCAFLGVLQYRSIERIAATEKNRLHEELHGRLRAFSRAFDDEVSRSVSGLIPSPDDMERYGAEAAYSKQYLAWKPGHERFVRRIALAANGSPEPVLRILDPESAHFSPAEWPTAWSGERERLARRIHGGPGETAVRGGNLIFEVGRLRPESTRPRHAVGPPPPEGPAASEAVLLVELNPGYLTGTLLPDLLTIYLGEEDHRDYDVALVHAASTSEVIYRSAVSEHGEVSFANADDSVPLLDLRGMGRPPGPLGQPPDRAGFPGRVRFPEQAVARRADFFRSDPPPQFGGPGGRWLLLVRNRAGSLDALVTQTQHRNLAASLAVLLMILATGAMLLRLSRQYQRLAELQLNFVAGISHELRTPLTVIRTAAWNLRNSGFRSRPAQVERYGQLIEEESEKLEDMVEQVLDFASARAGHIIRERQPIALGDVIEDELQSRRAAIEGTGVVLEEVIGTSLPITLADSRALRQTIRNLLDNAMKYGTAGANWIGIYVEAIIDEEGAATRIRVADRGPGIPPDEQGRIFDPFFRGRRAIDDQVHGTGLGLNLVKSIIEAHGGSIRVSSGPSKGTEFTIRLPAAPPEFQHAFAHSSH